MITGGNYMYRIGLSSCGFELTEENFAELSRSNISAIEISMAAEKYSSIDYKEVSELSKRYNVELWSYHLPFFPFSEIDISSLDSRLRENAIRLYSELMQKATNIGINKFVIHPSGEPIPRCDREERIKYSMQTLDTLAEIAHGYGAVLAVEDLPRTCLGNTADEICRLVSANDKLRVCLDTNHLLTESNVDFVHKLADRIITLHVSDYDLVDEKHWLPGEGVINWNDLFSALKSANYSGVWMYELGLGAPRALTRSRKLTFDDFVKNAKEIFDGKQPSKVL